LKGAKKRKNPSLMDLGMYVGCIAEKCEIMDFFVSTKNNKNGGFLGMHVCIV